MLTTGFNKVQDPNEFKILEEEEIEIKIPRHLQFPNRNRGGSYVVVPPREGQHDVKIVTLPKRSLILQ